MSKSSSNRALVRVSSPWIANEYQPTGRQAGTAVHSSERTAAHDCVLLAGTRSESRGATRVVRDVRSSRLRVRLRLQPGSHRRHNAGDLRIQKTAWDR